MGLEGGWRFSSLLFQAGRSEDMCVRACVHTCVWARNRGQQARQASCQEWSGNAAIG